MRIVVILFTCLVTLSLLNGIDLKKVSDKYQGLSNFNVDFSLHIKNKDSDIDVTEKGQLLMVSKTNQYLIHLDNLEIFCNGTTKWVYLKDVNEVTISNEVTLTEGWDFLDVLSSYEDKYTVTFQPNQTLAGVSYEVAKFTPLEDDSDYLNFLLFIHPTKHLVDKALYNGVDGTQYTIVVKNYQLNLANISSKKFEFDPSQYKGVYIEDLRD